MRHKDTVWANVLYMFILILYLNFYILYSITQIYKETKQNFANRGLKRIHIRELHSLHLAP